MEKREHNEERMALTKVWLYGVGLDCIDETGCINYVLDAMERGEGGWVITANLDHLRRAVYETDYGKLCRQADMVVADGMPLIWASVLQGTRLPERVAGSSLIWTLTKGAAERGRSVFLLGGEDGTADAAAKRLCEKFEGLTVAGIYCPEFGFENDETEMARIIDMLRLSSADIVYVALGSPKQERLISQIREVLPAAWWMGVGISFSFVCGDVQRAPKWMQKIGLEWAHRLIQEPRRLARRYLVDGLPFAVILFYRSILSRFRLKKRG